MLHPQLAGVPQPGQLLLLGFCSGDFNRLLHRWYSFVDTELVLPQMFFPWSAAFASCTISNLCAENYSNFAQCIWSECSMSIFWNKPTVHCNVSRLATSGHFLFSALLSKFVKSTFWESWQASTPFLCPLKLQFSLHKVSQTILAMPKRPQRQFEGGLA